MARRSRKGAVVVLVTLVMLILLAFGSLVLDLGYGRMVQGQLQAAADAAALGGAARLDGTTAGLASARQTAVTLAGLNVANGDAVVIEANAANDPDGDVVLGTWAAGTFTPSLDPDGVDAVLVRTRSGDLTPFVAGVAMGQGPIEAGARSIGQMGTSVGAGEVPYYLPFGLPECMFDEYTGDQLLDMTFELNPAGTDNTGWALINSSVSAASLAEQLYAMLPCMTEWAETGDVTEPCTEAQVGDDLGLANGDVTAALKLIADLMVSDGIPWKDIFDDPIPQQVTGSAIPKSKYGNVLIGPLPIFDGGDDYCEDGGSWNQSAPLVGFTWAVIYDVRWKGPAAGKNVWVKLDPTGPYSIGSWYPGSSYGVTADGPPVVVQ